MTQPTVSKHWRNMFKESALILPGPCHRVTIIQRICSETIQRKKYINTRIYAQWNGPSETKPNPENCKNCSSKCAYDCAQLSVHNTAQNSSDNLPSYRQTIIIAQMLSIGGERGALCIKHKNIALLETDHNLSGIILLQNESRSIESVCTRVNPT